jgi:hypothetical protein
MASNRSLRSCRWRPWPSGSAPGEGFQVHILWRSHKVNGLGISHLLSLVSSLTKFSSRLSIRGRTAQKRPLPCSRVHCNVGSRKTVKRPMQFLPRSDVLKVGIPQPWRTALGSNQEPGSPATAKHFQGSVVIGLRVAPMFSREIVF